MSFEGILKHIFCTREKHAFDRSFAIRSAFTTQPIYQNVYDHILKSLQLDLNQVTLRTLSIQNGCDTLLEASERLVQAFFQKFTSTLTPEQLQHTNPQDPALITAIFVTTAAICRFRIDKKSILEENKINPKSFNTYLQLIKEHAKAELDQLQTDSYLIKRSKRPNYETKIHAAAQPSTAASRITQRPNHPILSTVSQPHKDSFLDPPDPSTYMGLGSLCGGSCLRVLCQVEGRITCQVSTLLDFIDDKIASYPAL